MIQLTLRRLHQMESPDDVDDFILTANLFGVVNYVANARMGTACDDDQSLFARISQRRIIQQKIGLDSRLRMDLPYRFPVFEIIGSFDLAQKDQAPGQPEGFFG